MGQQHRHVVRKLNPCDCWAILDRTSELLGVKRVAGRSIEVIQAGQKVDTG